MSNRRITRLIQSLRSSDPHQVVRALEALQTGGWLKNGSLVGADLRQAHLREANLRQADLRRADLRGADLRYAVLSKANLQACRLSYANCYRSDLRGANLEQATFYKTNLHACLLDKMQLMKARALWGATMPDGSLYDGRYRLPGDLDYARVRRIDVDDPVAMASFYKSAEKRLQLHDTAHARKLSDHSLVQLIRKLRHSNNLTVRSAIDELRIRGHLTDGSLQWVYLRFVNMSAAILRHADLRRTDLNMAQLQETDLRDANFEYARLNKANLRRAVMDRCNLKSASLTHANLHGASGLREDQLSQASRMRGAMMPDGTRYDGRFNLVGDLADARFLNFEPTDPASMANFYDIPTECYLQGQTRAQGSLQLALDANEVQHFVKAEYDLESLFSVYQMGLRKA